MASAVENFTFNELPRRLVVDSSLPTGSSLTAGWVLVASGLGFQAIPTDPVTLGFEPTVAPATGDQTTQYYRGDKTWQTLDATAVGAIASSEKGIALGVATLDADGYVLLSQMNPSVIERVVIVADQAARYALTTLDVQNGDVVNQQSPSPATMWFVVDQDNLGNSGGYLPFSAGIAGSVAWSGVTGKPAIIGDLEDISLAAEGDLIQFVSGNWVKVNAATLKSSLSIQTSDVSGLDTALGNLQPKGNNLTAVTDLATDGIMVMTNAGTATAEVQAREITVSAPLEVTNGTGVDDNPNISLGESEVTAGTYGDDLNYATFEVTSKGLLRDAGVRSIERPSLIIPNATVDYYLSNRTRHILGVAGTYGALSLVLPAGDTLQSGSWVEIIVNEDLVEFTDSVIISATGIQSVNKVSSINLVSYGLYPGSRIYCVYEHLSSEWVVTVNNNSTFRSLTVVNPASTDFNESHLIESAALQPRTVFLPDADVDLTNVAQAASSSEDGYLASTDWNTFNNKQAALANVITAGTYGSATQYPVITYNAKGIATGVTLQTVVTPTTFSDSVFRVQDNSDATKQIAFEAGPISSGVTRTITMGDANVDLGTMVGAKDYGSTVIISNIPNYGIVLVTTNMTVTVNDSLLFGRRSKWYNPTSVAKTLTFSRSSPFFAGTFRIVDPIIGAQYGNGFFSAIPFAISYTLLPFATIDIDWDNEYEMRLLDRAIAYPSQWKLIPTNVSNSFYGVKFATSGGYTTANRTITVPDADVNLGKIPASLSLNATTATLTQTLADSTSLSADLSAIAVNQVALTGASPTTVVTVTGTQASTKYFLAGNTSLFLTFDVTAFTNTGKFIEIVNNTGSYRTITLDATSRNFRDEVNDLITSPVILVRGESLVVFPVNATTLQVYRNKPDVRNIKNNSNTVISGFKTTNLFVDSSFSITGQLSANADEILRVFALANSTIAFGNPVYDARTDTQISTGSYTMYAGQVIEVTKTSVSKWVILGGHIQDTSRFRLYNSSNVPTKFDTSAATAERTITMPNADVNLGALKSLNTLPAGTTFLVQLKAGHEYFVTQSGIILYMHVTTVGSFDTSIGYSFSNTTSSDLTVTVRWILGIGTPTVVSHVDAISGSIIDAAFVSSITTYDYPYTIPKGGTIRFLPNAASNVTILYSFREFYGQLAKGTFTPVELLASSSAQNLAPNYSYYLPATYAGALNLVMPASAAIGTTFDIGSIYSNGIDGTLGANLTALNLTVPSGEYITGWGGAPNPINLLVSYVTNSNGYTTPNFTQGCTFRLTKTGATSWAIKPTFGSVLPKRFLVKNEGGSGGTVVSTTVPAGAYKELILPNADVNLGDLPSIATTNSNALSGTRNRILGGSSNAVSGTDNVVVTGSNNTLSASGQVVLTGDFIAEVTWNCAVITAAMADSATYRKTVAVTTAMMGATFWSVHLNEACTTGGAYSATTVPKSYLSTHGSTGSSATFYTLGIHTLTIIGRTENGAGSSMGSTNRFVGKRRVVVSFTAGTVTVDITTEGTDYSHGSAVTMNITNDAGKLKIAPFFTTESASETNSVWNVLVESVYTTL